MEILRLSQRAFTFVGFIPGKQIFRLKIVHTIISLFILLNLFVLVATSVVYVVRHLQIGYIENVLKASFQISATTPLLASFITIIYHRDKVREVIETFQEISNKCNLNFRGTLPFDD